MLQFLSKLFSPSAPSDFSRLGTDLHSHLLPGLDDGVQTLEESLEVIEALSRLGYTRLITTPHVMTERYPNSSKVIREQERLLKDAVRKAGIPVEIKAAAEYYLDENFGHLLEQGDLLPLDAKGHVLFELSFHHAPLALGQTLFDMQAKGFIPVLAHPERYPYFHQRLGEYQSLQEAGCLFQVNILSITGHYGIDVQQAAQMLLKHKMVRFLGTDVHRIAHVRTLSAALRSGHLEKTLRQFQFANPELV